MKHIILRVLFFIGLSINAQQSLEIALENRLHTELEKETIKSGILHVYSETHGVDIQLAKSKEDSISIHSPFYTASITKMLTATAIGILRDQKKLNFSDSIAQYLPPSLLSNLHIIKGKDYSKDITIVQLLQHTSGLPDYFTDETKDGSPNIITQLLIEPNKLWSSEELIHFSKEKLTPLFIPGEGYHYTDTEYVLLALVIENVSGLKLNDFFHQYIFQPLKMNSSYINLKSTPIAGKLPLVKFYASDYELSLLKSLSADWGGGGLVSTTHDLITFLKAFNSDKIVKKETRQAMQNWVKEIKGMDYGYGLRQISLGDLTATNTNLQLMGHSGSAASFLWFCPQLDTYISGSLNQLEASKSALLTVYDVLEIIENY